MFADKFLKKNIGSKILSYKNWVQKNLGKGSLPKKNYESLDICPNWVYPTYLEAQFGQKKVWTSTLLSTLPTYPKSLDILKIKFAPKRIFSQFCKHSIG